MQRDLPIQLRVLFTGGGPRGNDYAIASAEIFDPKTMKFTLIDSMNKKRREHIAILLRDGRVLIVGGRGDCQSEVTAEIFDPLTSKFCLLKDNLKYDRTNGQTATLLNDKRVLILGANLTGEVFNLKNDKFYLIENKLNYGRDYHAATLLKNGEVLITGGSAENVMNKAEIFDPLTNIFQKLPDMNYKRIHHCAVLLKNGKVLIAGGNAKIPYAELFNPENKTFSVIPSKEVPRFSKNGFILLKNGDVLLLGGRTPNHYKEIKEIEIYKESP